MPEQDSPSHVAREEAVLARAKKLRPVARRMAVATIAMLPVPLMLAQVPSAAVTTATITNVSISGTVDAPVVTVTGSGFGTQVPTPSYTAGPCPDRGTGRTWYRLVRFQDYTNNWSAGYGQGSLGDCVGIVIDSWSDTSVQFEFGSAYQGSSGMWQTAPADTFQVNILGASYSASGGRAATVVCATVSGQLTALKIRHCRPNSTTDKQALGGPTGLTWAPSGETTVLSVTSQDHIGGSCPHTSYDLWVSGSVTGGTSSYTSVGDPVVGNICVNARTGSVTLTKGTSLAL